MTKPRTARPAPPPAPQLPGARINRRAADRLRGGYLWVYASDIESVELPEGEPPALLPVADSRGLLLGTALYSPASQITLRMISREAIDEAGWPELLAARLRAAIARLRKQGETVVCVLPGHENEVDEFQCDRELKMLDGRWSVIAI